MGLFAADHRNCLQAECRGRGAAEVSGDRVWYWLEQLVVALCKDADSVGVARLHRHCALCGRPCGHRRLLGMARILRIFALHRE